MYRKYKVGTVISTQNLQQLETPALGVSYKNTILANCASKIFTGNGAFDELQWWSGEFGTKENGYIQTLWIWRNWNIVKPMEV